MYNLKQTNHSWYLYHTNNEPDIIQSAQHVLTHLPKTSTIIIPHYTYVETEA